MVSGNHNDKAPTDDPSKLAEQKEIEESVEEEAEQQNPELATKNLEKVYQAAKVLPSPKPRIAHKAPISRPVPNPVLAAAKHISQAEVTDDEEEK